MIIEEIHIRNFKALKDVHLIKLPPMSVFVGKNGTGKTTLFRVFAFLKECLNSNVKVALQQEGGLLGFKEVITRGRDLEIDQAPRLEVGDGGEERPRPEPGEALQEAQVELGGDDAGEVFLAELSREDRDRAEDAAHHLVRGGIARVAGRKMPSPPES